MVTESLTLFLALAGIPASAEDDPVVERDHLTCFLSERADGSVWIEDLSPHLPDPEYDRRFSVYSMYSPGIRLAAGPARDLAPLAVRIDERTAERLLPHPQDGKSPIFVLNLDTKMRREAISARVVQAEILTPEWMAAWEALEAALKEVVAASLTAPGEAKGKRLREAIEAGSRALDRMEAAEGGREAIAMVKAVEPQAEIVRMFHSEAVTAWGERLRQYATRLRIEAAGLEPYHPREETRKRDDLVTHTAIRPWGVEVSLASEDTLAAKLALKGAVVDRVAPEGSKIGLRAGDLILTYSSLRDAEFGRRDWGSVSPLSLLARRAESGGTGGELRVIRGDEAVTLSVPAPIEEQTIDWDMYLHEGADGVVRIEKTVVHLGMYGEMAYAPVYKLSPDVARILAPLVTRPRNGASFPWYARMPRTEGPMVLLDLRARTRVAETDWATPQQTWEIVEAHTISAEFVTPEWVAAWEALDDALGDVISLSLTAPGEGKRERLAEAFARGSSAIEAMGRARESEEMRPRVTRIDPKARIVRSFARRVAGPWCATLGACAATLRIDPPAPLARAARGCEPIEILLGSRTPEEFVAKLKASCGDEALDDRILWSQSLRRTVSGWEIEGVDEGEFARLKEVARKTIEDRRSWEEKRRKDQPASQTLTWTGWGVEVRKADADLLAQNLILRGTRVEKVLPGGSRMGLEAGDIILDYASADDIVMGGYEAEQMQDLVYAATRLRGRLRVLRGDRVISIQGRTP